MKRFIWSVLVALWVAPIDVAAGDLWLIDTRPASIFSPDDDSYHRISFAHWDATNRRFTPATKGDFLSTCDGTPLLFLFHGNWTNRADAVSIARDFYRRVENERCRVVMWTWPSERVDSRPRVDARAKARRADLQASYLVWFLRELESDSRVALAGFSYGARLVAMALEEMSRYEVEQAIRISAILMAAAFDSHWLYPGQRFENAVSVAEKCDILYNPDDDRLCFYPLIDGGIRGRGPTALGATGIAVKKLNPSDQPNVRSINVSRWIGVDHSSVSSLNSMLRYPHFREVVLFEER